ncbi:sulfur oxidation c-type cytochrome SoxX [Duganella radicis]|uniref:Sulfur oxidation c-type cytochrome SoxX n=1 Tax=Duganella radicis TaxID=551988 RepID=A0A6L6PLJ3_9BURK|nr:sulfur oxidation c-type cytochrome SoxX [Duganella radicis]MTV39958.1 sulfur oxidation c-type cytochrome SoxX [Duganella radicis]
MARVLALAALLPAATALATPVLATDGAASPPPGAAPGDPARGRAIVANRQLSLCLLCHTGPIPEDRFQGNLAPDLRGVGQRWTADQLRQRIMDASQFNPSTIMPAYHKTAGLNRVAATYKDKTILTTQQIEDVVAWLQTLREPTP